MIEAAEAAKEGETTKAPESEKARAVKKVTESKERIRYNGASASYTLGRYRFEPNSVLAVEKELAKYALKRNDFEGVK